MGASSSAPTDASPAVAKPVAAASAAPAAAAPEEASSAVASPQEDDPVAAEEARLTSLATRALHAPLPPLILPARRASEWEALFLPSPHPDRMVRTLRRQQRVEDLPQELFEEKAAAAKAPAATKRKHALAIPDDNGTVLMNTRKAQSIMWGVTSVLGCIGWEVALRRMPTAARLWPTRTLARRLLPWATLATLNWSLQLRLMPPKMREPVPNDYVHHIHTLQMLGAMGIRDREDAEVIEPIIRDRMEQHRRQQLQPQTQAQLRMRADTKAR